MAQRNNLIIFLHDQDKRSTRFCRSREISRHFDQNGKTSQKRGRQSTIQKSKGLATSGSRVCHEFPRHNRSEPMCFMTSISILGYFPDDRGPLESERLFSVLRKDEKYCPGRSLNCREWNWNCRGQIEIAVSEVEIAVTKLKLPWVKLKLPWPNWNCRGQIEIAVSEVEIAVTKLKLPWVKLKLPWPNWNCRGQIEIAVVKLKLPWHFWATVSFSANPPSIYLNII